MGGAGLAIKVCFANLAQLPVVSYSRLMKVLQGYDGLIFWHICFRRVTNATIGHGRPVIGGKGSDLGQFIWSNAALLQYSEVHWK